MLVDQPAQAGGEVAAGEADPQIVHHVLFAEVGQRQLDALPTYGERPHHVHQCVLADDCVSWTEGPDHQEPCRFTPLGEEPQQVDGGLVAPLQVLEHQQEGHVSGQCLDEDRELAQHALGPDGLQRLPQRGLILGADQPGHLSQPCRCDAAQQLCQAVATLPAHQTLQRLDHGRVRFAQPVLFDTGAASNPDGRYRLT